MTPRIRIAALLVGGALTLAGCNFAAPIDPTPTRALDPALLGTWRCLPAGPEQDSEPANFVVSPAAQERVYAISLGEEGKTPDRYEGYESEIIGQPVLNVRALEPAFPRKPWTFARYSFLLPDVLRVQLVDEDLLEGVEQNPSSLRTALERLDARPELYVDYCVCVRAAVDDATHEDDEAQQ